jgi:hypothetical protein
MVPRERHNVMALFKSDTSGSVTINGVHMGQTPLQVAVGRGDHTIHFIPNQPAAPQSTAVASFSDHGSGARSNDKDAAVKARTTTEKAATASVATGRRPSPPAQERGAQQLGYLRIQAPFELQVTERGTALGGTSSERLALSPGVHELDLSNTALDFRSHLRVEVRPGATTTATVTAPSGSIAINALPWAEVFVDGRAVGTTPIANLNVPVGFRDITWRHPELGVQRRTIPVTAGTTARAGVVFEQ